MDVEYLPPSRRPDDAINVTRSKNLLKSKLRDLKMTESISEVFDSTMSEISGIEDPVLKFTLLCTGIKLICTTTLKIAFMVGNDHNSDLSLTVEDQAELDKRSQEMYSRMEKSVKKLTDVFTDLNKWIRNPVYSPDVPFGKSLMKSAEKEFKDLKADKPLLVFCPISTCKGLTEFSTNGETICNHCKNEIFQCRCGRFQSAYDAYRLTESSPVYCSRECFERFH